MFSIIYFWSGPLNLIWATWSCMPQKGHRLLKFNDIPACSMISAFISLNVAQKLVRNISLRVRRRFLVRFLSGVIEPYSDIYSFSCIYRRDARFLCGITNLSVLSGFSCYMRVRDPIIMRWHCIPISQRGIVGAFHWLENSTTSTDFTYEEWCVN